MVQDTKVLLAFGSNEAGVWGDPSAAIQRAFDELGRAGVSLPRISRLAVSRPLGAVSQPDYINAVAVGKTTLDPEALLALAKRLEQEAGRLPGPRWGPRPLDIDILDFAGLALGWAGPPDPTRPAHLVLPHPELHKRAFVLEPLIEVAPGWRHPVLGMTAEQMLAALV